MQTKEDQFQERIISVVTETFGIPLEDIIRQVRKKRIAEARQVVAYCLRLMTEMSFPEIGELLGGRDHTTIMHACSKIAGKIENNEDFRKTMESVLDAIRNPHNPEIEQLIEEESEVNDEQEDNGDIIVQEVQPVNQIPVYNLSAEYEIPKCNLELDRREIEILDLYRHGKTLQEIATVVKVTRERVRQIALRAMLKEVGQKIKDGFEIDVDEYMKGEKATHEIARFSMPEDDKQRLLIEYVPKATSYISVPAFAHDIGMPPGKLARMFPEVVEIIESNFREKKDRWSKFYIKCRGCGTTTIPHARQGYCEKCLGIRSAETRQTLLGQHGQCSVCSIDRGAAIRKYGKDLYIMKDQRVLCRGCFLQLTGNRMVEGRWGRSG